MRIKKISIEESNIAGYKVAIDFDASNVNFTSTDLAEVLKKITRVARSLNDLPA